MLWKDIGRYQERNGSDRNAKGRAKPAFKENKT